MPEYKELADKAKNWKWNNEPDRKIVEKIGLPGTSFKERAWHWFTYWPLKKFLLWMLMVSILRSLFLEGC